MQVRNVVSGMFALSLLAGCSSFTESKQVDYQAGAVQTPPLEVPPNLISPARDQRYTIPGAEGGKATSYSEYSKQKAEQPCLAPEAAATSDKPAAVPAAKLQQGKGGKTIQLGEPFDRSWRKVGLALEKARIKVTDKDRSKGIYFIAAAPDKDNEKLPDRQVVVREHSDGCDVRILEADGKSNTETARLVETLFQNLEK